ncbi:thioesterase II family protein [Nocardia sp. NPDC056611]|uniref:thioesterase II family protein n=1 Tax=Nocardia sp. NPDC056611 TaxID=3345877 RepID=UPI00366EBEE0
MSGYLDPVAAADPESLRLFCFHHAGGGSSPYRGWQRALGPHIAVRPVLLPGRERRGAEPRFSEIEPLLADLDARLDEHLAAPHVFFGHSMGGLIAYRLACRRRDRGATLPAALIISGCAAPHLPWPLPPVEALDDAALIRLLTDLGGLPAPILEVPALLTAALPVIRDDLRVCADARNDAGPPLPCPIHAFGGEADPLVGELDLTAWREHTTVHSEVRVLPGDHFSQFDRTDPLFDRLRPLLRHYAAPGLVPPHA